MTYEEIMNIWNEKKEIDITEFFPAAKMKAHSYPMIVLANLSQNTYIMMHDDRFLCNEISVNGSYDDLIDDNMENIHPNYQRLFYECFSREHLIRSFQQGKTEVYAEVYQKNHQEQYHWVSAHVIRLKSASGDVTHICFNRILENNEKRYWQK